MTAVRRMSMKTLTLGALAAATIIAAQPALAQNSDAPVDVTAAPPPSSGTVGPSQLRDFSLNGTVTRPADSTATVAPPPPGRQTQPAPSAANAPRPAPAAEDRRAASSSSSPSSSPAYTPPSTTVPPSAGAEDVTPAPASVETQPVSDTTGTAPEAPSTTSLAQDGGIGWPWIIAILALIGGGAFIAWSRHNRRQRYGDPGRLAFAGLVPDAVPDPSPQPPARPRHDPVPPRSAPKSAPSDIPPPRRATPPAPPPPAEAPSRDDGLIVSTRLKPELAIQFQPDRAVITESDVMLQFDVVIANSGSAPAREVLVEACMVCAHAGQDAEIAAFFQKPAGQADRIAAIPPLGRLSLKSAVRLPLSQVRSFEVEGRKLFVPLVAFNILYSGNLQTSASFLVGRGDETDEKLAPFRLDLGPRIFRGLSSRPHSGGLARS